MTVSKDEMSRSGVKEGVFGESESARAESEGGYAANGDTRAVTSDPINEDVKTSFQKSFICQKAALREFVRQRAGGLCEYCLLAEALTLAEHEIDHVIALKHGGQPI